MAEELPKSIYKKFEVLEDSLDSLQNSLQPFLKLPVTDVREKVGQFLSFSLFPKSDVDVIVDVV